MVKLNIRNNNHSVILKPLSKINQIENEDEEDDDDQERISIATSTTDLKKVSISNSNHRSNPSCSQSIFSSDSSSTTPSSLPPPYSQPPKNPRTIIDLSESQPAPKSTVHKKDHLDQIDDQEFCQFLDQLIYVSTQLLASSTNALSSTVNSRTYLNRSFNKIEGMMDRSIRSKEKLLRRRNDELESTKIINETIDRDWPRGWVKSSEISKIQIRFDEEVELTRTIVAAEKVKDLEQLNHQPRIGRSGRGEEDADENGEGDDDDTIVIREGGKEDVGGEGDEEAQERRVRTRGTRKGISRTGAANRSSVDERRLEISNTTNLFHLTPPPKLSKINPSTSSPIFIQSSHSSSSPSSSLSPSPSPSPSRFISSKEPWMTATQLMTPPASSGCSNPDFLRPTISRIENPSSPTSVLSSSSSLSSPETTISVSSKLLKSLNRQPSLSRSLMSILSQSTPSPNQFVNDQGRRNRAFNNSKRFSKSNLTDQVEEEEGAVGPSEPSSIDVNNEEEDGRNNPRVNDDNDECKPNEDCDRKKIGSDPLESGSGLRRSNSGSTQTRPSIKVDGTGLKKYKSSEIEDGDYCEERRSGWSIKRKIKKRNVKDYYDHGFKDGDDDFGDDCDEVEMIKVRSDRSRRIRSYYSDFGLDGLSRMASSPSFQKKC